MRTNRNAALDQTLTALRELTDNVDMRWLREEIQRRLDDHYRPKLYGIAGGHSEYPLGAALKRTLELAAALDDDNLTTLAIVVNTLYDLMEPQADSRGTVQTKTIIKSYVELDWETGMQMLDENGHPVFRDFPYTYAYVRLYAGRGDANRKGQKLLSIYADRGMGKGGKGGVVAAAYGDGKTGLVTQDEILDAWHAGKDAYAAFMDYCKDLIDAAESAQTDPEPGE